MLATFEDKVVRAIFSHSSSAKAWRSLKTDPLSGKIWVVALSGKAGGVPKSVAVSISGER